MILSNTTNYFRVIECSFCAKTVKIPSNITKFQCASCRKINEISKKDMTLLKSVYGGGPKPKIEKPKVPEPPKVFDM